MGTDTGIKAEVDRLKAEIEALRAAGSPKADDASGERQSELAMQFDDLTAVVQSLFEEAEETVARHPTATIAGALALGIVIGRLTAR